ncbi:MAG: ATP-binding protein [Acidobacteria bacterium]|nr:ATP-binding protein [Acidobacteriota bacterium]
MLERPSSLHHLVTALGRSPVTALLGPRQCGKTTLARMLGRNRKLLYFDLEHEADRSRLQNPDLALGPLRGLVVLDEAQRMPVLFEALRVLVDRPGHKAKYLILGSASPFLVRGVSESLAGRVEFVELGGFDLSETGPESLDKLWTRGGFPRSFLARSDQDSYAWRESFIRTFLERDVPQLGLAIPSSAMRRFWTMLAHSHGQTWNASKLARSMGLTDKTVRSYLDVLTGTFLVRQLQPWHTNVAKRQVKAPKIYLRDSGVLHRLLGIEDRHGLLGHPQAGASWEGFALEQTLAAIRPVEAYFWSTHGGAELDLFFVQGGRRFGIEFKLTDAPTVTRSMRVALDDLRLRHLWVIHAGRDQFPMDEMITAWPLREVTGLATHIDSAGGRGQRRPRLES